MANIEPLQGIAWLVQACKASNSLLAAAPGGIWQKVAPQSALATTPFVVVSYQGGHDVNTALGGFRIMHNGLYQVAAIGPDTQMSALASLATLIDQTLQGQRNQSITSGGTMIGCVREEGLLIPQVVSGSDQAWSRIGGLYRLFVV